MKNNQKKKETYVKARTSMEEKKLFERYAEERGVTVSAYIKEQCLENNKRGIYNKELQQTIGLISNILYYEIEEHCNDEVFIKECKKGAERLWHCLK